MKTFRDLAFFVMEAFIGMKRSGLMVLISIATISVSMLILGFFALMVLNVNNLADIMASRLEIRIFLKGNLTQEQIQTFQGRIEQMTSVKEVKFVDRVQAWDLMKHRYDHLNIDHYVKEDILPDSFRVQLTDAQHLSKLAHYLEGFDEYVDEVIYGGTVAERIQTCSRFLKVGGFVVVGLLTFATLLIVVNTIRLTVIARQNEILIMQLVGATNAFIKGPFMIEGLILGVVGSSLSVLSLKLVYGLVVFRIQEKLPFFPVVANSFVLAKVYFGVAFLGAFLGGIGAYISVSRSLKIS